MGKEPAILDMTIEGEFVTPPLGGPHSGKPPLGARLLFWAIVLAAVAFAGVIAVFALWLLAFLIPLALLAALVAYVAFRIQLWRNGGSIQAGRYRWGRRL